MSKKLTAKEFIERAKNVHGNKYDYGDVWYIRNHTKVKIYCPEHGEFMQTPKAHLRGQGCPKCGAIRTSKYLTKTTQQFIIDADRVHFGKYDYSKVEYMNSKTRVEIVCPEHGPFEQTPNHHLRGVGCSACVGLKKLNTKIFTEKSKLIHKDKYDYDKVKYINNSTKVKIICLEHGEFWQAPCHHLRGVGCPACGGTKKMSNKSFIEKSEEIHGGKYDYSLVEYKDSKTKIKIICPEHGEFWQTPNSHLIGRGCSKCNASRGELRIEGLLKKEAIQYYSQYKLKRKGVDSGLHKYDFYIPSRNLLIEYDGGQHFKPIKFFGGEEGFRDTQRRDAHKNELAAKADIELLRIPYWDFDNIESILADHLDFSLPKTGQLSLF